LDPRQVHHIWYQSKFYLGLNSTPTRPKATQRHSTVSSGTSMTLEERFEALMKQTEILVSKSREYSQRNQEIRAQNEYLQKQLGAFLKQKQQANEEPLHSASKRQEQVFSHTLDSSSEDQPLRMTRQDSRNQASTNDFKIEIPEFEGKLDPEDFLDWVTHS